MRCLLTTFSEINHLRINASAIATIATMIHSWGSRSILMRLSWYSISRSGSPGIDTHLSIVVCDNSTALTFHPGSRHLVLSWRPGAALIGSDAPFGSVSPGIDDVLDRRIINRIDSGTNHPIHDRLDVEDPTHTGSLIASL